MVSRKDANKARLKRHIRVRAKISGTAERPRLCVYRSNANISAQIIDDVKGITLVSASTLEKAFEGIGSNKAAAKKIGLMIAERAKEKGITFSTPSEVIAKLKSVDQIDVPYPLSWVDEERDISCWLGNTMQREAFNKLYSVADRVLIGLDKRIKQDWDYLQASNNFRFMTTKENSVTMNRSIYDSPYDAFTNYMNILGDFISRVNSLYPIGIDNEELNALLTTIKNQDEEIEVLTKELEKIKGVTLPVAEEKPKKAPAKKPAAKKAPAKKKAEPKAE